jgi:predicted PurR-regulated permease PerM
MTEITQSRLAYRPHSVVQGSALSSVLLAAVIVGGLYFAREILVPIALAVLLSFVLAPAVTLLQRIQVPRSLAVIAVVSVAFAAILGLGAFMASQLTQLAGDLPRYQTTLREKIQGVRGAAVGTSTLERASEVLQDLGKELDKPKSPAPVPSTNATPGSIQRPITVEVKQPDPGALQTLAAVIAPLIHPLTTTGIVLIFVIFILIQKQDLRNRLIRLAGAGDIQRTTAALDDAGQRLSRLFLTQLALNAAFGVVIGTGLAFIGVPSAPLWGMLAMILRFVPYVGAAISAVFPLILAAAVGSDWRMVLWTAALFVVVEPIAGHVIEPLLYGHSTGLSPVAVVASATFWTWLWGPIGLVLATPLTVCLVGLGRHVDRLKFLDVMFGDRPALTPPEIAYQRMLAADPVEAAEQADKFLKEKPLVGYYQDVLIEGLKLAARDARRGTLDQDRAARIRDAVAEIVDDLSDHQDVSVTPEVDPVANLGPDLGDNRVTPELARPSESWRTGTPVLCIPGATVIDEAATLILAQLIGRKEIGVRAERADALSVSRIFALDTKDVAIVCLCYVEEVTAAQLRYAVRRLRRKAPAASVVVAHLGSANPLIDADVSSIPPDTEFVGTLPDAIKKIESLAQAAAETKIDTPNSRAA